MTIADLQHQYNDGTIYVDHDYQRSPVWPVAAQSFLIDTILSGYPLPGLCLSLTTNLKLKQTRKAIVDGQQRTLAIIAFIGNKLRITTKASKFVGKTYEQLDEEDQQNFLAYAINVDLFTNATEDDVREVFRRMNWYTAPANDQEKRHSKWSGEFKQFISLLAKKYDPLLIRTTTFNTRSVSRMGDTQFLTECAYSYIHGIRHSSQARLNNLYGDFDIAFPFEKALEEAFDVAFQRISHWDGIYGSNLTKEYNLYSLVTAAMHVAVPSSELAKVASGSSASDSEALENLLRLNDALEDSESIEDLQPFVDACEKATNREMQKSVRFQYFVAALTTGDFAALSRRLR